MGRCVLGSTLCAIALLAPPALAGAAPAPLAISSLTPELQASEDGGSKLELTFTDLTTGPAVLEAEAVGQPGCKPSLEPNQLKQAEVTDVAVEVPESCRRDDSLELVIRANLPEGGSQTFRLDPEPPSAGKPDWSQLWKFGWALIVSLAFVALVFLYGWDRAGRSVAEPLRHLDATWKFNDNWATNVTAVGGLLSGLFGATTAKAFLGSDAEALTSLLTVGAAVTLIFVGAAPIVALTCKSLRLVPAEPSDPPKEPPEKPTRADWHTVGGVLLAAALVGAGGLGQIWIAAYTASELGIGATAEAVAWGVAAVAAVLLGVYSWRTLSDVLDRGTEPGKSAPDEGIVAAKLIVAAIEKASGTQEEKDHARKALATLGVSGEELSTERYRHRPRSALL